MFRCCPLARSLLLCLSLLPLSQVATATSVTLYDDSVSELPSDQPWLSTVVLFGSQTVVPGDGVNLVTNNSSLARGGYSNYDAASNTLVNPAFPTLDSTLGFDLGFQLQVNAENHASTDRAGFSVILLGDDNRGIELGFWGDQVWAQSDTPLFTHAEDVAFDTTIAEVLYDLAILGSSYDLSADGVSILQGSLRDYTAFGGAPYTLPNYVFLGDDTGSAGADITLGQVLLTTVGPVSVPAPPAIALLLVGLLALRRVALLN